MAQLLEEGDTFLFRNHLMEEGFEVYFGKDFR